MATPNPDTNLPVPPTQNDADWEELKAEVTTLLGPRYYVLDQIMDLVSKANQKSYDAGYQQGVIAGNIPAVAPEAVVEPQPPQPIQPQVEPPASVTTPVEASND